MRILLLALLTGLCACGSIGTTGSASHSSPRAALAPASVGVAVSFSPGDIEIIRAYYQAQASATKGKGKSRTLPPGIAKNLRRGKPLPPGIARRALPHDLQMKLRRLPDGYDRVVVAGKILLIELGTQIVRDILTDAAFG